MFYTVRFTTRKLISKYDDKGKKIGEYEDNISVVLSSLPYSTAMQYEKCDNFQIERCYSDPSDFRSQAKRTKPSGNPATWGGMGPTKNPKKLAAMSKPKSNPHSAAMTGDLSAAINEPSGG